MREAVLIGDGYPAGRQVVNGLKGGLRTLPYVGGKSNFGGPGNWIARLLATAPGRQKYYVEPFAGTLGILLRRNPVSVEICNDADGRIVNFFRVCRDKAQEFAEKLLLTAARAELEFLWAKSSLDHDDSVMAAIAVFIVLKNSIPASLIERSCYTDKGRWGAWQLPEDVYRLADRLRLVRFVVGDGIEIIRKNIRRGDTLIYMDPPYPDTLGYDHDLNRELFLAAVGDPLRKAHVAVSGFAGSWPELEEVGLERHARSIHLQMDTSKSGSREEVLYTSWTPHSQGLPLEGGPDA